MFRSKIGFSSALLAIAVLFSFSTPAVAQTAQLSVAIPPEGLLGEQFCFTTRFENFGPTGFGPYLRVSLPPSVLGDSVTIFDKPANQLLTSLGAFPDAPGNQIIDPKIDEPVTGTPGDNFYLVTLPVGAVLEGGPVLDIEFCASIDVDAELGVPLPIVIEPVYQFGDTATGQNGPIIGAPVSQSITPVALLLEKSDSTPESQRPPGSIWPYNYTLTANIAEGVSVTPVVLTDTLPAQFQFNGSLNIAGGGTCSATQQPSTLIPGGTLEVSCTNVPLGLPGEDDIVVTYGGYITDILNELSCDQQAAVNLANGLGTYVPAQGLSQTIITEDVSTTVTVEHLTIQKQASPTTVSPNSAVTFTLATQVTQFDSVTQLTIVDTLPDGLSFVSHNSLTINGSPVAITPTVVLNANSTTTVTYNIVADAGIVAAGSDIMLSYAAVVLENYLATGEPVHSGDSLTAPTEATYQLASGATPCTDASSATIDLAPVSIDKTLLNPQPHFRPGDQVVFQLTKTIPAGSSSQIIFSDYLPLPAFDVSGLNLNTDIDNSPGSVRRGTGDTANLDPTSITINNSQNLITIAWPNAVSAASQVIQVELTATVTSEPFADSLFLTNIFLSESRNTAGEPLFLTDTAELNIGAPSLTLTKGVVATTGLGSIAPPPSTLPVDGDITGADGNDIISYRITLENAGNALAYDVLVTDPGSAPALQGCTVTSVVDGNGATLSTSGSIATGLTLTNPLGYPDPTPADNVFDSTALVTVDCTVSSTVAPGSSFENTASVIWSALPGGSTYPEQTDIASATIQTTSIQKLFVATSEPTTSDILNPPRVTIGEIVRYRLVLELPEGQITNLNFRDRIPNRVQYVNDGSATVAFISNGGLSSDSLAIPNIAGNSASLADVPSSSLTFAVPAGAIVGAPFNSGGDPRFNLGTVTNNDSDNDSEFVVLELNAVINNTAGSNRGSTRSNRFAAFSGGSNLNGNSNLVRVRVAEPQLRINKRATPTTGDASDLISYTITVQNSSSINSSPAYEVTLNDVLPMGLAGASNITFGADNGFCTNLGALDNSVGDNLSFFFAVIQPNCRVEISFDATLTNVVAPGTTVNNQANVVWSSLNGTNGTFPNPTGSQTPGAPGTSTGERTDSGGVNDYNVSDDAPVNIPGVGITKIVSSTDQPSSGSDQDRPSVTDLLIGEQATFLLTVTVPEGMTPLLVVTDTLPFTNGIMRLESAQVVPGSIGANLTVEFPAPAPQIGDLQLSDGIEETASFNFGEVINDPNGIAGDAADQIQIEVVATLVNQPANQSGDRLNNHVLVQFGSGLDASTTTPLDVIEPALDVIKSGSISQGDAGDLVTYTVEISHANGSTAIAQDLVLTDLLPADLLLDLNSVTSIPNFAVNNSSGNTLALGWTDLPLNTSIVLVYQAELLNSVESGDMLINTANLEWDSIPGADPDERTNSANGSHEIIVTAPGVNKEITATSEPGTGSGQFGSAEDLTIGEVVTYQFTVRLPEGTSPMFVVYDQLPTGSSVLQVVSSRLVSIGANLSGAGLPAIGSPGVFTDTNIDLVNDRVTWTLGDILNTPDGASNDDDLLIFEVTAVVLDLPVNQSGVQDQLNLANASSTFASASSAAAIDLVAPDVALSKSIVTPADSFVDAGDAVISRLTINHSTNSTADSYTNVISDALPNGLSWVDDSTVASNCIALTIDSSGITDIVFSVPELTLTQDSCQIEYELIVDNNVQPGQQLENSALLNYDSTPVFTAGETRQGEFSAVADVVVIGASLIKLAVNTSEPDTTLIQGDPTLLDLTIGETVTYELTIVLPEGVLPNVVLTDLLPVGAAGVIEAIGASVTAVGGQLSTTLPGTAVLSDTQDVDGLNDTVMLDFGTITNVPDGLENANDRIVVEIVGRVADVPINQDGLVLTNFAELSSDVGDLQDTADVEVVAPQLSLDKRMSLQNNGVVRITIELENTGTAPAYDIEANDILSDADWLVSSLTPVSISNGFELNVLPDDPNSGEQTVRITSNPLAISPAGTITVGETISAIFDVQLAVLPPVPNPLPNEATLDAADTLPGNNNAARDLPMLDASDSVALPELQLQKTGAQLIDSDLSGTVSAGDTLRYTLVLQNLGVAAANNLVLDDVPDANSALVVGSVTTTTGMVTVGNTAADTTIQVAIPTLAVNGTVTLVYDTVINNPLPAGVDAVVNQAIIDSDELLPVVSDDPNDPTGNIDPTVIPIEAQPDLTLTKDDGGATATAGGIVSWAMDYANLGTQGATGVVITDVVPQFTTFEPASSTIGWTCSPDTSAGSSCALSIGDLAVGESGSVLFSVNVDATVPAGIKQLDNTASVADDGTNGPDPTPDDNVATDTTPLEAAPDLAIVKSDGGATAVPGQLLSWGLQVNNIGSQGASGVVVTDTVPANSTFDAAASTAGWGCVPDGNPGSICSINIGDVAVGDVIPLTYTVLVDDPLDAGISQIDNTASVSDDGRNGMDPNPGNNTDSDSAPTGTSIDLAIEKSDGGITAKPGDPIAYTLGYRNLGNQGVTGVVITESVPLNTSFDALNSSPGWICAPDDTAGSTCMLASGNLASGAQGAVTFAVVVDDPVPAGIEQLDNSVSITDDGANGPDSNPINNIASDNTPLDAQPDLTLTKDDGGATATAGGIVSWSLGYENVGNQDASGVFITDVVPQFTTFQPASSTNGWTCLPDVSGGSSCTLSISNLAVAESGSVVFSVVVDATVPAGIEQLDNTANVADDGANGPDPTPGNNTATDSTPLDAVPDLAILKSDGGATAVPGELLTWNLEVTNIGSQGASGVVVTETVPANTTFDATTSTAGWACVPDGNAGSMCSIDVGAVAVADISLLTFTTLIDDPLDAGVSQVGNTATVSDDGLNGMDPNPDNNTSSDSAPTGTSIDLAIEKIDGGITVEPGDSIPYTLNFRNLGNQGVTAVVITETVPLNTSFDALNSSPGWACTPGDTAGSSCTLAAGDLAAGGQGVATFAVVVNDPIPASVTEISNSVSITDDGANGADTNPDNNVATEDTPVDAVPDMAIVKSDGGATAMPGDLLTWDLEVTNVGNQGASGVVVADAVPANTTFDAAASSTGWSCVPDDNAGSVCSIDVGDVAVGDVNSLTFVTLIDDPLDAGISQIDNTATVSDDGLNGADPDMGNNTSSDSAPTGTSVDLAIEKTDGGITAMPGDLITYSLNYRNLGNQGVTGVVITETVPLNTLFDALNSSPGWVCAPDDTAGSSCTLAGDDLDGGAQSIATFAVVLDDPIPESVTEVSNSVSITDDGANGADSNPDNNQAEETTPTNTSVTLALVKSLTDAPDPIDTGSILEYTLVATNEGNSALTNVVVSDSLITPTGGTTPCARLEPTETCTLIGTYQVTQADVNLGMIENTGTASSDQTEPVQDELIVSIDQNAALVLVKQAMLVDGNNDGRGSTGETIDYQLIATNNGNTSLTEVLINDPLLGVLTCLPLQPAVLAPGASLACSGSYVITFNDIVQGSVVNVADVMGEAPNGEVLTDSARAEVPTMPITPVPVMNGYAIALLLLLMSGVMVTQRRRVFKGNRA